jgi:lipopolysaccharide transport system ATP-binding protein
MLNNTILRVTNVSKQYRLGTLGTKTIGGDVHRWWTTKILGKEDPFLKVGDVNDRTSKGKSDFVWALKDINFEVKRGEVLGIIGKNGAGKSTLLKLLSRITSPTTGSIESWGRMASLLEVGTGFHPELTGRENIFLNGAILGMTKGEIKRKLDEIIDFSGCALYIDTPVKRYSSGMTVRLGFAVAAFLDPEILIVDEVLAVGDAEFQKKAIGKMKEVSFEQGRTVLFVSHNLSSINNLCNKGIVLSNGRIDKYGIIEDCLTHYKKEALTNAVNNRIVKYVSSEIKFLDIRIAGKTNNNNQPTAFSIGDKIPIEISIEILRKVTNISMSMDVRNESNELIAHIINEDDGFYALNNVIGIKNVAVSVNNVNLIPGNYHIDLWFGRNHENTIFKLENALVFSMKQGIVSKRSNNIPSHSFVYLPTRWSLINAE